MTSEARRTPLQMVQAFGAIANGGHMMKPYVIKEIDNPDGSIYKKAEPTEVGQPVSADVSKTISKIMAEEISSGGVILRTSAVAEAINPPQSPCNMRNVNN